MILCSTTKECSYGLVMVQENTLVQGKRCYHVNSICQELGEDKGVALPFVCAFSFAEATSQCSSKDKMSVWKT